MTKEIVRRQHEVEGHVQAVIVEGRRTVYIAGQTAQDERGAIVGAGDFRAQCRQVFTNLEKVLAAAGATVSDLVKTTVYIVDYDEGKLDALVGALYDHYGEVAPLSADTVVGVQSLYKPEFLIEIDAVAVID